MTQDKNKYNTPKYRLTVRFTNTDIICQVSATTSRLLASSGNRGILMLRDETEDTESLLGVRLKHSLPPEQYGS